MQYYEIDLGGLGLTSDGLNVWLYKTNVKDVKELFEGYSSSISELSGNLKPYEDKAGFKRTCQYIDSISDIEKKILKSMDDLKFSSMKDSYNKYLSSVKEKGKELPKLVMSYKNFSVINDGMAIWIEDKTVKGNDKRIGGWYTNYNLMLEEFTKYLMNTIRTTDRKELREKSEKVSETMEGMKTAIAKCKFAM